MKMTLLVGYPGSGKSTYAETLDGVVVNQDTLGSRKACLDSVESCLNEGMSVIIDRTNINKKQRKYFLDLAKKYGIDVNCVILDVDSSICFKRICERKDHPTITENMTIDKKRSIIEQFKDSYETPEMAEGFVSIHRIRSNYGDTSETAKNSDN